MQQNEYSMTNTPDVIDNTKPYFTLRWLGMRTGLVIVLALCATILAVIINEVAFTRKSNGFLSAERLSTIGDSISYAFIIVLITLMSTTLVEVIFRKPVNAIQYSLSACAMSLFYLLLTSFSELMPFGLSYLLSCIMILGMLTIYLNAITRSTKAAKVFGTVLVVEYAFIFILLCLNRFALLTGSLGIFLTLAIMMYFTIRLRVRNGELQINR